ncbi:MAG: response regulator transcription factor [Balneolaceae bacterium]|nr:response regulator transcription factor [Balneolaceae bacterium]MBO6544875.1 response regulator transcription factor [Balneolaceae bacterium]MBO6646271.1 response regulator transcription factor [Balneolaceae bacterium]
MKDTKILLVEDDKSLNYLIEESLESEGYSLVSVADGMEGYDAYYSGKPDLIILDIMLPKLDGFSLARKIRISDKSTPIIFLTAKEQKKDIVEGFKIGCDDYVLKPFSLEELYLRIVAVLRRVKNQLNNSENNDYSIGEYKFLVNRRALTHPKEAFELTTRETDVLQYLCRNLNERVSREDILIQFWERSDIYTSRSLDVFISKLRKYLSHDDSIKIESIRGYGFKLLVLK